MVKDDINMQDAVPIVLPCALDLRAAKPLAVSLLERRNSDVVLDGAQVEHLGGLCLQVLASAAATWKADGRQLTIANASSRLLDDLRLLGISPCSNLVGSIQ